MKYKGIGFLFKQYHMVFYDSNLAETHKNHET